MTEPLISKGGYPISPQTMRAKRVLREEALYRQHYGESYSALALTAWYQHQAPARSRNTTLRPSVVYAVALEVERERRRTDRHPGDLYARHT